MSWRERLLVSFFVHLLALVLALVLPQLQFVQDAAQRRAERLAALTQEEQRFALLQDRSNEPTFIFVEPLIDTPAPSSPPLAPLSDLDRVAQSPDQSEMPLNDLPNAEGNSFDYIQSENMSDDRDLGALADEETNVSDVGTEGLGDVLDGDSFEENLGTEDSVVARADERGQVSPEFDAAENRPTEFGAPSASARPGRILNQALGRLDGVARSQSFHNLRGQTDRYGPDIQFDSKGADFGVWIRRFRAQIYRNWFIPYAAMSMSGNVVLTFNVHKDGALTELAIQRPSTVDAFTNSAYNALRGSNPTYPLPPEYPDDQAFFTVTFYFNERPPGR